MSESEVAQIQRQIQAEYEAAKQGLSGLASGTARHGFIQIRTEAIGKMLQQDILASLPGLKSFICKNASVSPEHFDRLVTALPGEWKVLKTCYEYYLAYGQKREGGTYE